MNRTYRVSLVLVLAAAFAACGGADSSSTARKPGSNKPANAAAAVGAKEARQVFDSLCFTCHGMTGHGDGPGAAALDPKPRTFADVAWQDSVTDEQIVKTVLFGGAAVGKSPMMPAQPQLKGKDEVLKALVKIVREFRGK
ncbi:MAG TPA: c-type cytochrome [Planctomycetota bacterium]|nr:c-type cytochrome [Planctomycetota bacterium]